MFFLGLLAFVWSFIGGGLLAMALFDPRAHVTLLHILAALGPGVAAIVAGRRIQSGRRARHAKIMREAGVALGQGLDHEELGTGIGLNPRARTVTMWMGDLCRTYAYDELREWRASKVRSAGGAVGYGLAGTVAAGAANIDAGRKADAATGFFVYTRDLQHAMWRISMHSEQDQARWMEIFRQHLNDEASAQPAMA